MGKRRLVGHDRWQADYEKWRAKLTRRVGESVAHSPDQVVRGSERIAAYLGISESQLRAMRDPNHPTFDPRIAAAVVKHPNGRLTGDAFVLADLAWVRARETSAARRAAVGRRRDRSPSNS